eukprot:7177432-Prymnesium_polylepis.1
MLLWDKDVAPTMVQYSSTPWTDAMEPPSCLEASSQMGDYVRSEYAFAAIDMLGHLMPLVPLMDALGGRGHTLTLFAPDDPKYAKCLADFGLTSVRLVPVRFPAGGPKAAMQHHGIRGALARGGPLAICSAPLFDAIARHYSSGARPAALIADFFATAAMDAADALSVPVVVVYPNPLGVFTYLLAPPLRGIRQRSLAALANVGEGALRCTLRWLRNKERRTHSLPPLPVQDLYPCRKTARTTLVTVAIGFEYPHEHSPLVHFIGPSAPPVAPPLAPALAEWLAARPGHVVYVGFGSMHTFDTAAANSLLRELELFAERSAVAVLWSLPAAQQALFDHVPLAALRVEPFVAQWAVLAHQKTVAFASHCGANSVAEALLNGVPLVCSPGMADQPSNAARVVSAGVGVLARKNATGPGVGPGLEAVLADLSTFRTRAAAMKEAVLAAGGAQRGAVVVEEVARGVTSAGGGRAGGRA